MLNRAITKLKTEIEKNKDNPRYIQVVGGFLLQHLDANPGDAEKILDAEKTIEKSLEAMRKEAEKKRVGNCAVLTDREGFAVVLKYFGIEGHPAAAWPGKQPEASSKDIDFDVKLDDLLD